MNTHSQFILGMACCFMLWPLISLPAQTVRVEGSALIQNGDIGRARLEAQQNALREASLHGEVRVQGQFISGLDTPPRDQVQLQSSAALRNAQMLEQRRDGEQLHVQMQVTVDAADAACDFTAAAYRKKLAAVHIPLLRPGQVGVNDYYGYEEGIGAELLQRLATTGAFLTRNASETVLYAEPMQAPFLMQVTPNGRPLLMQLAEERGVQFVISGVLRDIGVTWEPGGLVPWSRAPNQPQARQIEIEFFVHDALTSELLGRHRYARSVTGTDVIPNQPLRFGTREFFRTPFGQAFEYILNEEVAAIIHLLQCRPCVMQVLEQREGQLIVDAGSDTRIQSGDVLTVYRPDQAGRVFGSTGRSEAFGWPKVAVRVLEVFPAYSLLEPEKRDSPTPWNVGEYLRVW